MAVFNLVANADILGSTGSGTARVTAATVNVQSADANEEKQVRQVEIAQVAHPTRRTASAAGRLVEHAGQRQALGSFGTMAASRPASR